ncbi:MAG: 3-hydroxyacyl-CoA dehydrogenase [Geminicoccaceae bacterium]|nr:MAG: 3-hydroxyacyl-CoA dehydrogenase [Geminicoccaceae bacterium]
MTNNAKIVAIVGTGLIGRAWAAAFARAGWSVRLWDPTEGAAVAASIWLPEALADLHTAGLLDQIPALDVTCPATLQEAVQGVAYVQESAPERLDVKLALWADLDRFAPIDAVLASSTSAIPASRFTEKLEGRGRCLVAHPLNPPHLIPAVELVPTPWTVPATVELAEAIMTSIGQAPIRLEREIEAFVVNRLQMALLEEAFRLVEQGVCDADAIDVAVKDGLALRWAFMGPFETIDLNAPGGVRDYVQRYQGIGEMLFPQMQWRADWAGAALERIEATRRAQLPTAELPERTRWRDRRLMALLAHKKRTQTDLGD